MESNFPVSSYQEEFLEENKYVISFFYLSIF